MKTHTIVFRASGRGKAQCAPDADYPHGKALVVADHEPSCMVDIPYPAPECGLFLVTCNVCGLKIAITAAGRPDDPISVVLPCAEPEAQA